MHFKNEAEKLKFCQDHAVRYWAKAKSVFGEKIGEFPVVMVSKRMTKTAGMAYFNYDRAGDPERIKYTFRDVQSVRFSSVLLGNPANVLEYAVDIIPHELTHFIAYRVYGEKNHGEDFYKAAKQFGVILARGGHTMRAL